MFSSWIVRYTVRYIPRYTVHKSHTIVKISGNFVWLNRLHDIYPLWVGAGIHPPFPCVSYEATKRVSRWQCVYKHGTTLASCVTSTGMPAQNAAKILKALVPNSHSTIFTHVADWDAPFSRSQHPSPLPLKFLHTPPSPPPSPFLIYVHES